MKKEKTFIIIDGHAIIHRAYHAIPPLTARGGTVVNAVYGFSSMLLKVLDEFKPTYLAVSFDVSGGTFRDEIYKDYKATRKKPDQDLYDQIPLVYDVVRAFGIPIYEKKGFEADDVIGTLAKLAKTKHKDLKTIIVTGDQDMLQLVDDDIVDVYLLRRGVSDFSLFNESAVKEKFGFGPEKVITYKSIKGDSSDNIPGVRGIGDKGAKQLIAEFGSLDEIYEGIKDEQAALDKGIKASVIKKLKEGKESAEMSRELATICQDVKDLDFVLKDCFAHGFDTASLEELFKSFEFFSLLKRIPGSKYVSTKKPESKKIKKQTSVIIVDDSSFEGFVSDVKKEKRFVVRDVLSGDDVLKSEVLGFVFVTFKKAYYLELKKLSEKNVKNLLDIFVEEKYEFVGHDLKSVVRAVHSLGVRIKNKLFDVMVASYLTNSGTRAHGLREIVLRELGDDLPVESEQKSLFGVDPSIVATELSYVFELKKVYENKLKEEKLEKLFDEMEMPLIFVLAEMEMNGIAMDEKLLEELSVHVTKIITDISKSIWEEAGEEFNISSSVQLRKIFFEKLGLPTKGIKKGKTGYSTAASELEKLRDLHPIISMVEQYRETEKLRNTYIDVLPKLINKKTKRLHSKFNQTVAATGRLSSSDPNIQNIPIRTELGRQVRDAFVAEDGYLLVAADYSQIELRVVAALAKDKTMLEVFEKGEDIHSATAAAINEVELDDVTKEMRRAAKEVNFGVLYGMGPFGLASRTGIPQWQAKEFIEKYFERFDGVDKYVQQILVDARENGYVETYFGRRRYVPELTSGNYKLKNAGERIAVNMPIQGTAADVMKLAMIAVQDWIEETYKDGEVKLLLQVHDELVLEVKEGLENEVVKKVEELMEDVVDLGVPIVVEAHVGKEWGKLK